jgi:hypothetical protein
MRNLALNVAAIMSFLGVVVSLGSGVVFLAKGNFIYGMSLIVVSSPVCFALAVVFDYVGDRLRRDVIEGRIRGKHDVIDTPWEDDPNHL